VLTQTWPLETGAVVVLALGVLAVAAVGVALSVGVAATTGATVLDFLTRLCGVADATGLGLGVSVWDSASGSAMKESNAMRWRIMRMESVLSEARDE
jgi:hypothetical protein